jgi:HSP20 family protein
MSMAADNKGYHQREENPHQGFGTAEPPGATASRKESGTDRSDQERSIQTGREANRSAGVSRRSQTPSVVGPGAGQLRPFTMMRRMAEDMDRLFENFGLGRTGFGLSPTLGTDRDRDLWSDTGAASFAEWTPQVEAFRRGDKLVVRADLPGLKKDDVNVEIDDGLLTISGERREEREDDRGDYYRSERTYGQFYRAIPLPEGINENQCDASFNDGVLEITFPAPKQEERRAKRIQVK